MRKVIGFVIIMGLITIARLDLATTAKGSLLSPPSQYYAFTISGKVLANEDGILSIGLPGGEIFKVAAKSNTFFEGIEVGDRVAVKEEGGWAASVNKIGKAEMKQHTKQKVEENATPGDTSESAPATN